MLFNSPDHPVSYMYYDGNFYLSGSEIELSEEYRASHKWNGKPLWKYAYFGTQTRYNNQNAYIFWATQNDWHSFYRMGLDTKTRWDYAPYFVLTASELNWAIEKFTKPQMLSREKTDFIMNNLVDTIKKENKESPTAWAIYICLMVGSLIFTQWYLAWILISICFFLIKDNF